MDIEDLINRHFDSAPATLVDEFFAWSDEAFELARVPEAAEYRHWWGRLSEVAGGSMPPSMQIDVRSTFGEMAQALDRGGHLAGQDVSGAATTVSREQLIESGLSPTGLWQADVLLDRCAALDHERQLAADVLAASGGGRLLDADRYGELLAASRRLVGATSSIPAQRTSMAVSTWCCFRLGDAALVDEYAQRFFALDRQGVRESGAGASVVEFARVATATVAVSAQRRDRDALDEAMRQVRLRVEVDGQLGLFFAETWARGLAGLDPHFAQLIAQRLLFDLEEAGQKDQDAGYSSAFLLFEMHLAAGDVEAAELLAQEWVPLAMEAEHGPGVHRWLESITIEAEENE